MRGGAGLSTLATPANKCHGVCCCRQDGSWAENLSSYFNMNTFLDIILSCVLKQGGNRRIVFSCFDPDICIM